MIEFHKKEKNKYVDSISINKKEKNIGEFICHKDKKIAVYFYGDSLEEISKEEIEYILLELEKLESVYEIEYSYLENNMKIKNKEKYDLLNNYFEFKDNEREISSLYSSDNNLLKEDKKNMYKLTEKGAKINLNYLILKTIDNKLEDLKKEDPTVRNEKMYRNAEYRENYKSSIEFFSTNINLKVEKNDDFYEFKIGSRFEEEKKYKNIELSKSNSKKEIEEMINKFLIDYYKKIRVQSLFEKNTTHLNELIRIIFNEKQTLCETVINKIKEKVNIREVERISAIINSKGYKPIRELEISENSKFLYLKLGNDNFMFTISFNEVKDFYHSKEDELEFEEKVKQRYKKLILRKMESEMDYFSRGIHVERKRQRKLGLSNG